MPPKNTKSLSFEQSMARLDEISARLDNPETGLEETIRLVEEGLKLVRSSRTMLDSAELRIKMLENPEAVPPPDSGDKTRRNDEHDFSLI